MARQKGKKRKYMRASEVPVAEVLKAYDELGSYSAVGKRFQLHPDTARKIILKAKDEGGAKPVEIDWPKLARLLEAGDVPTIMAEFDLGPEELKREIDRYATLKEAAVKVSAYSESAARFTRAVKPLVHWYFDMGEHKRDLCRYFKGGLCTRWHYKPDDVLELEALGHKFGKDEAGLTRMKEDNLELACAFCFAFLPKEELVKAG